VVIAFGVGDGRGWDESQGYLHARRLPKPGCARTMVKEFRKRVNWH
jgi:hypothetical protein